MFRNFLLASVLLGFVAFAMAAPITFTEPNYSVTAVAIVGPVVSEGFDSSFTAPPSTCPYLKTT